MAKQVKINQATRRTAQRVVQNILHPTYFASAPLDEISEQLRDMGIVMVMEDDTEWEGFLCGREGEAFINLAPMTTARRGDRDFNKGFIFYTPYMNTGLRLTWYKSESRRDNKFEVIGYIS